MKYSTIISFACALASVSDAAFNLVKPRGASPIEYSLIRSETPRLRKRSTIEVDMGTQFEGFNYFVNISVGTPPQSVSATFDTGSSDLILNSASSGFCASANPSPCLGGAFNLNSSSTVKQVGKGMIAIYEIAEYTGNWYTDTLTLGGKSVENFVLGVADTFSNSTTNTFGVMYYLPEGRTGTPAPTTDNSLGQMVKAGLIPSSAYSIWMDRNTAKGGSVLLGGVDTSKFVGELQSYPIVPDIPAKNLYISLSLNITSIGVGGSKPLNANSSELPAVATLDTGNPNLLLPSGLVGNIYKTFGVQAISLSGGATFGVCECALASSSATLDIGFPGLKISIPFSDLVISPTDDLYKGYNIPADSHLPNGTCLFMVSPTRAGFGNILGDNFLRYTYYVVDLDTNQIGLAPSNPNPGKSQIMEIAAGTKAIPSLSATGAVATGTNTPTSTKGGPSSTGSAQPSTSTKPSAGNRLSSVDFGVMVGIVGLACLL
ncbi:aspartic peptidase domain-containing protein [Hyaloscypha sp. PMI_1271]|nr:aspartic peptidase domain-containing protein [Hyaloscypha sp. PMI_1271]